MRRWITLSVLAALVVAAALGGSPIHISYVYSDSMEPTINEGDGYLLVPAAEIVEGDIITFHSTERDEHVTHRVVEVTDEGYITQGDNNRRTDQAGGHPPITVDQVTGAVLMLGDRPLIIPHLQTLIVAASTYWPLVVGAGLLLLLRSETDRPSRDIVTPRHLMVPLVITAALGGAGALTVGAPAHAMTFTATEGTDSGSQIPVGESVTRTVEFSTGPQPAYTHRFTDTTGVNIADRRTDGDQTIFDISVPAQTETGTHEAMVRTYQYPAVLPYWFVAVLHRLHPFVAALATTSLILTPIYLIYWIGIDDKEPFRSRSRPRRSGWLRRGDS